MARFLSLFIALLSCCQSFAQGIIEIPLESNQQLKGEYYRNIMGGRNQNTCPIDTLPELPFIDDFSANVGFYPDCSRWTDNDAFINNTMAYRVPSLGVATLDGIRFDGYGYSNGVNQNGRPADSLTSQPIDMSLYTPADGVFLSFFLQAKGLADAPESLDSFFLELKDVNGNWATAYSSAGISPDSPSTYIPDFEEIFIAINSPQYFYDGFQFRFRNHATITGANDHWHIDYVILKANRTLGEPLNDVALTEEPRSFLSTYTAMPWRHFQAADDLEPQAAFAICNHFQNAEDVLSASMTVKELTYNQTMLNAIIFATLGGQINFTLNAEQCYYYNENINAASFSLFQAAMGNGFANTDSLVFETRYAYTQTAEDAQKSLNNIAAAKTIFHQEFAYDDGVPETRIIAQGTTTQIAVRFHTTVSDSLQAVRFHFPHFLQDVENELFNIKVFVGDLNNEIYSEDLRKPRYVDTLNGWSTYSLSEAQFIPAETDFWVSWQQVTNVSIPVGFDKNNARFISNVQKNINGVWSPLNPDLAGVPMIRPYMGNKKVFTTGVTTVTPPTQDIALFPNPTDEALHIFVAFPCPSCQIEVFNLQGQRIIAGELTNRLSTSDLPEGIYCLRLITRELDTITRRFVVAH